MEAWNIWREGCGEKLVDPGAPLGNAVKFLSGGGSEKGDSHVTGYSILEAESMTEATELLKDHPHLGWQDAFDIEVFETLAMPGS